MTNGPGLSAKKREAIEALLRCVPVEDAARDTGISPQTLYRWMRNEEFDAEYRAAKEAVHKQSRMRLGAKEANMAVKSILLIVQEGKKPACRLKAARTVIRLAKESRELEDFAAEVRAAQRLASQAQQGELPTGDKARTPGHGAKLPRKREEAIAALLTQRSIADAARTTGIGTQTMYRWLRDPAFLTDYAAAAGSIYGSAMRLAQQRQGYAVWIIQKLSVDQSIPETTRLEAAICVADAAKANQLEDLEARIAGMEGADANAEAEKTSRTLGINLHRRLQRIKALLESNKPNRVRRMILVHAIDGRPAGSSVADPDGRQVWWDPPEGYKRGEPVPGEAA